MRKVYGLFAVIILFTSASFAQESRSGKFGIGYSGNFSKNSNSLSATYWASNKFKIEPEVGVSYVDINEMDGASWRLGVGLLYTVSDFIVAPYVGLRVKFIGISANERWGDDTHMDRVISLAFGGEYFVSKWFSAGAEMRLNYIDADGSYSPNYVAGATMIETEQTLNLKIYFN